MIISIFQKHTHHRHIQHTTRHTRLELTTISKIQQTIHKTCNILPTRHQNNHRLLTQHRHLTQHHHHIRIQSTVIQHNPITQTILHSHRIIPRSRCQICMNLKCLMTIMAWSNNKTIYMCMYKNNDSIKKLLKRDIFWANCCFLLKPFFLNWV